MSNEFKPGHPVIFWTVIVVLVFAFYSAGVAVLNHRDCDGVSGGQKAWVVFPPNWECGESGVKLTSD